MFTPNKNISFRNATLDDLPEIVAIYNESIPGKIATADLSPVSLDSKLNWFNIHEDTKRPLWVCLNENSEIIGWISFQDFYKREAYQGCAEISIYFKETYRGKGLGKIALNYALDNCQQLNIHTLLAFIFEHNLPSIKLFASAGFELWGRLPEVADMRENGAFRNLNIFGKKTAKGLF